MKINRINEYKNELLVNNSKINKIEKFMMIKFYLTFTNNIKINIKIFHICLI